MDYQVIWFILIAVLFTGFFFLEGFDYGVGMLFPFVSKRPEDRSLILRTIGPVWDGNEVWMITAGGALFAAFPHVYATMFSTFYLALFLMLVTRRPFTPFIVVQVDVVFSLSKSSYICSMLGICHSLPQLAVAASSSGNNTVWPSPMNVPLLYQQASV